jgi:hypothetical protein
MLDVEGRPRATHRLGAYIHTGRDKSGMSRAVLKMPFWTRQQESMLVEGDALNEADDDEEEEDDELEERASNNRPRELSPLPPTSAWGATASSSSASSSPSLRLSASARGKADGGFPADFTAAALEGDDARGAADGKPAANAAADNQVIDVDAGDDSSEFDDFSDGGEPVNIIDVVNGPAEAVTTEHKEVALDTKTTTTSATTTVANAVGSADKEVDEMYVSERLPPAIGRCRAVYDYEANIYDELTIRAGDVIVVHEKQADGWWLGQLGERVGIFPATYVQEESH